MNKQKRPRGHRFNELGIGDIVRPRKSASRYAVTYFHEPEPGHVEVFLAPLDRSAPEISRYMSQLTSNWLMVKQKDSV